MTDDARSVIAFDLETTGLSPHKDKILGVSIAGEAGATWYPYDTVVLPFTGFKNCINTKVAHNGRFDLKFLHTHGTEIEGPFEDTMLMAVLVNENDYVGLKTLAVKYFGADATKYDTELNVLLKKHKLTKANLDDPRIPRDLVANYANEDTVNTLKLYPILKGKMTVGQLDYYRNESMPLETVLAHMELKGVKVDLGKLDAAEIFITSKVKVLQNEMETLVAPELERIRREMGQKFREQNPNKSLLGEPVFNWNSPIQKVDLFYRKLELFRFCDKKTDSGKYSLRGKDLKALSLPDGKLKTLIGLYLEFQAYSKLLSTYVVGIKARLHGDRIYAEFLQAARESYSEEDEGGTVTGRLSHRNPNLGNLPRGNADYWRGAFVKDLFIPDTPDHVFLYADYSQVELRVAAHLSQDAIMLTAFNDGRDLHTETMHYINSTFGLNITRNHAKTINFAIIYGAGGYRLCEILGWPTSRDQIKRAQGISDTLLQRRFPGLGLWLETTVRKLKHDGELTSLFGRTRRLPEIYAQEEWKQNHAIKQGCNFVVQSAAASLTKRAMIKLHAEGFDIRDQIHDSIICQCRRTVADSKLMRMKEIMEGIHQLSVPLIADPKIIETFLEK